MYEFAGRIRYSEVDSSGRLRLESLLDYFQDCCTFHGEDVGMGMGYMAERRQVWVLSAWQIVVGRYPRLGERVRIGTVPYDFRGYFGSRNFLMQTEEGERLAWGNTLWTLLDTEKGCPVRVSEEMAGAYVPEGKLPMDYAPRKIPIPSGPGKAWREIEIKRRHLDMNHHVNNGQYIRIAMEYLPDGVEIRQMRAEYKRQAVLGDVICPVLHEGGGNVCVVTLNDRKGQIYCVAEFACAETAGLEKE
ncbi:MAG: thioesterase [Lachnospiraceae bacterium]|nr:thioesterase [Lachnospiraceae bacterium]